MVSTPKRICAICPQNSGRSPARMFFNLPSLNSCSWIALLCCSLRSSACQAIFSSSSSMMFSMIVFGSYFAANALLEAAELGGHVGFADAQNFGDLAIALVFQVQQQQGAVEPVQLRDETVQGAHL